VLTLLREHWRPLAAMLAVALAYALGRYGVPERVVVTERVRVEQVEHQVVVTQERVRVERVEVAQAARAVHREQTTTRQPNGAVQTRVVEDERAEASRGTVERSQADTQARAESTRTEKEDAQASRTVEAARPAWRVHALVGVRLSDVLGGKLAPAYGAALERRVLGPLSVGAWGLSTGTVGVSVSLEF
jgi:hypothetical protein